MNEHIKKIAVNQEVFTNQDTLRSKLINFMKDQPISILQLSILIDVSRPTLNKFIYEKKDVDIKRIMKINKFISEKEQEKHANKFDDREMILM